MKIRATIKYRLELQGQKLKDLSDHLGITPDGLYKKLQGDISISDDEKKTIDKFLGLSKLESDNLWGR